MTSPPQPQTRQLKTCFAVLMLNRSRPPHTGHGPSCSVLELRLSSAPILSTKLRMSHARACSIAASERDLVVKLRPPLVRGRPAIEAALRSALLRPLFGLL